VEVDLKCKYQKGQTVINFNASRATVSNSFAKPFYSLPIAK
jgi:hypothetical protein